MTMPPADARRHPPDRVLRWTAPATALAWIALVFVFGGLHFDDFVNLDESRGALALTGEQWRAPAADGRWQPLKRLTYDALGRAAGMTFWPYALALAFVHALTAAGTVATARAIWGRGGASGTAGLVALAALNLSAYSIANVGTLHGMTSVALSIWAAAAALHGARGGRAGGGLLAASLLATIAACLYKETAVTTPAVAAYALWLSSRERTMARREWMRALAAPAAGVAGYFLLRIVFDIQLFPTKGRYTSGGSGFSIVNLAVALASVAPWAAAALSGSVHEKRWRPVRIELAALGCGIAAVVLPSLILPWTSPNFWYAAVPIAGLGTAALLRHAGRPRRAAVALAALMVVLLVGSTAAAWRRGAHHWGPYAESSVKQWASFPRAGGRIVWFDRDNGAEYGGLYRTIGPGERLAHALRVASGDPSIEAVACIDLLVGPPCATRPGDEIYLHSRGRLERVSAPPPGNWYVLP